MQVSALSGQFIGVSLRERLPCCFLSYYITTAQYMASLYFQLTHEKKITVDFKEEKDLPCNIVFSETLIHRLGANLLYSVFAPEN